MTAQSLTAGFRSLGARLGVELLAEEHLLESSPPAQSRVLRQPLVNRLVHWLVALSVIVLFFSGFGQMPLYKRYMLSEVAGLGWTAEFGATLLLHYLAAGGLIFAVSFHLIYHGILRGSRGLWPRRGDVRESLLIIRAMLTRGVEPPSFKYLAEQRLAYLAIGGGLVLVILTGLVKVVKNLPGVGFPQGLIAVSTHLHNLATVVLLLAIVGHLLALLIPANRPLVGGIVHGQVDRDYVEHRHPLWYLDLLRGTSIGQQRDAQPPRAPLPSTPAALERAGPSDSAAELDDENSEPAGLARR